jgi:hypothetical protein
MTTPYHETTSKPQQKYLGCHVRHHQSVREWVLHVRGLAELLKKRPVQQSLPPQTFELLFTVVCPSIDQHTIA